MKQESGIGDQESGAKTTRPSGLKSCSNSEFRTPNPSTRILFCLSWLLLTPGAYAGAQVYAPLSASVRAVLQRSVSDQATPKLAFATQYEADFWLNEMSRRLQKRLPDTAYRTDFLKTVHYEARRAGLEPELVLGLIEVESNFKKYAVSSAGARGYMQVMPFWVNLIGQPRHNLFSLRTNLRYGCVILRYYLDLEKGDFHKALARYAGRSAKADLPALVEGSWRIRWAYAGPTS